MNLSDLFAMLTSKGLTLARLGDRVTLKGATGAITPEIVQAVALHRAVLLPLLPQEGQEAGAVVGNPPSGHPEQSQEVEAKVPEFVPEPSTERSKDHPNPFLGKLWGGKPNAKPSLASTPDTEDQEEAQAVQEESRGTISVSETLRGCEEWDTIVSNRDWRDWRLEWLTEVGVLTLRIRAAEDTEVRERLTLLADLPMPQSEREWISQRDMIEGTIADLQARGKEALFPWPPRRD